MVIKIKRVRILALALGIVLSTIGFIFTRGASHGGFLYVVAGVWAFLILGYMISEACTFGVSRKMLVAIVFGILIRFTLATWTSIGSGPVVNYIQAFGDQGGFIRISMNYYDGLPDRYAGSYPYFLTGFYNLMGPFVLMARYVSVLFWFLGLCIIFKFAKGRSDNLADLTVFAYCFLPWSILISISIMRESILSFFLLLSFYYLWEWMHDGRLKHLVISILGTAVPVYLHTANIFMSGVIVICMFMWDQRTKSWKKISFKSVLLIVMALCAIPVYNRYVGPSISYLPIQLVSYSDIVTKSNYLVPGRTNYVPNLLISNWGQFIAWSIYRMLMFWMAPAPWNLSSGFDLIGFVFDALPTSAMLIYIFARIRKMRKRGEAVYAKMFTVLWILFTFLYGWGTRNGGTAMRHRNISFGIIVMMMLILSNKMHLAPINTKN